MLGLGMVRWVSGHQHHEHGDDKPIPLHEIEYVQDPADELERKWGFEVSLFCLYLFALERGFFVLTILRIVRNLWN